ncbi:MAG: aminotransferase class I/II-fold pyridoxal phosphate-dependent enzyme [Pseudonocardiaceae bacterium]|nr:aminotransferase class I/II-fold pyridoxal phosphate-dependent enzyme [Pseudonocardiaceae bacterium]
MARDTSTALPVRLDRASPTPLAVQLADALRARAASGQLRSGDRLPSTRALAARLRVSRTVAAAAYEQLHAEGWIAGRHGSGTYVTTTPPGALPARPPRSRRETSNDNVIDLTLGSPWADGLDRAAWRRAWRASADVVPLLRPQRTGLPEFRTTVAEHLLRHRGLVAAEDSVLATSGTSAAAGELAAAGLFGDGATVAVEEPGYQRAVGALRACGIRVLPAPVDDGGLIPDAVPAGVRAVYCSPSHQYPLGGRMIASRRVALVERARAEGMLVIEDDYDGELRYDVAPLPLLAALAPDVVVHLGTTSKILTPTLGIGWMVAPPSVGSAVLAHRERTGTNPAAAGQRVLVELARNGDLARHLRKLRRELAARRALLVDGLTEAGVRVLGDDAGAHVVVPLPSAEAERAVLAAAARRGIWLDGLRRHHAGKPGRYGVAVGYTSCARPTLRAALGTLVSLFQGYSTHPV